MVKNSTERIQNFEKIFNSLLTNKKSKKSINNNTISKNLEPEIDKEDNKDNEVKQSDFINGMTISKFSIDDEEDFEEENMKISPTRTQLNSLLKVKIKKIIFFPIF